MFITILVYHSKTPDTTLLAQVGPQQKLASFWRDILIHPHLMGVFFRVPLTKMRVYERGSLE